MNHRQWEQLANRVKKESCLFVDTQDWYVRRTGYINRLGRRMRTVEVGLSCIDTATGEHYIFWSAQDWATKKAERSG